MKTYICTLILFLGFLFISCRSDYSYEPKHLRKLSSEELIERARMRNPPNIYELTYKNQKGEVITRDSLEKINKFDELAFDDYVDKNGVVRETIVREATEEDKVITEKIKLACEQGPIIRKMTINCSDLSEIGCLLDQAYDADQENRKGGKISWEVDFANLEIVVNILDQCGMLRLKDVGEKRLATFWLVVQHAAVNYQKQYLPLFKASAQLGELDNGQVLMMEDRILLMEGKPQVYGTQVIKSNTTGAFELYEVVQPEYLDHRRISAGLQSINEYLAYWGITFDVPQKKKREL